MTVLDVSAKYSDSPILEDWVVLRTDGPKHNASPGVVFSLRLPADWVHGWRYRQCPGCGCVERLVGDDASEVVAVFSCPAHGAEVPGFGGWNQRDDEPVVVDFEDED